MKHHATLYTNLLFALCLFLSSYPMLSTAQDGPACQMLGDVEIMAQQADPDSYEYRAESFLANYSLEQIRASKNIQMVNGDFVMIIHPTLAIDDNEVNHSLPPNTKFIPVAAHIIRKSDGSGGMSIADLQISFFRANNIFRHTGFQFDLTEIRYIDDSELHDYTHAHYKEDESGSLLNVVSRNVPGKINTYFVPRSYGSWSNWMKKKKSKQHILLNMRQSLNIGILAHELGHWFNLYHTHETAFGRELVDGSNCRKAGDLLCDTPADPYLVGKVSNCMYVGSDTDANGDSYNPHVTNVMGYPDYPCMLDLTVDQQKRILYYYKNIKKYRDYTFCLSPSNGLILFRTTANGPRWYWDFDANAQTDTMISNWGYNSDLPLAGDFNGDGRADLATFRPLSGYWHFDFNLNGIVNSSLGSWGTQGDLPLTGDFNNDGRTDVALFRPSTSQWFFNTTLDNGTNFMLGRTWGVAGDLPFAGDFNGDGTSDIGVFRPSTGYWYFDYNFDGVTDHTFGPWAWSSDLPIAYDHDGDGKFGVAVYRGSTAKWYFDDDLDGSTDRTLQHWGQAGDIPVNVSLK